VLISLGAVEQTMGRHRPALERYREARELLDPPRDSDERLLLAESHSGVGTALSALGKYRDAIAEYEQAHRLWSQRTRDEAQWAEAQLGLFRLALNLAAAYRSVASETVTIIDSKGPLEIPIERFYHLLLDKIISVKQHQPDLANANDELLAKAYNALGDYYLGSRQLDRAEKSLHKARSIAERQNDLFEELIASYRLAIVSSLSGRRNEAVGRLNEALDVCKEHHIESLAARIVCRLATVSYRKGELEEARLLYRQSAEILDGLGARPVACFNAWFGCAITFHRLGKDAEAIGCLKEAIGIVELARAATVGGDVGYDRYSVQFNGAYDLLVKLLLERNSKDDIEEALYWAETAHNRMLEATLRRAGVALLSGLDPQVSDQLIGRLRALLKEREELRRSERFIAAGSPQAQQLHELEQAIRSEWVRIQDADPLRRRLLGETMDLDSFREKLAALRAEQAPVLYYYLGNAESYVWAIGPTNLTYHKLMVSGSDAKVLSVPSGPLTRGIAEQLVARYVEVLRDREKAELLTRGFTFVDDPARPDPPPRDKDPGKVAAQALALTRTLLPRDLLEQMQSYGHLVIIPDGVLHGLPFEALPVEPGVYVIDRFPPIAYAPSIRSFPTLQASNKQQQCRDKLVRPGVGFEGARNASWKPTNIFRSLGIPAVSYIDHRKLQQCRDTVFSFGVGLPGAKNESWQVTSIFRSLGIPAVSYIDQQATEGEICRAAPRCRLLHIAAHAVWHISHDNCFGHVKLFNGDKLELHEILLLDLLGCELVVLSGCETKVGAPRYLEMSNSLARGFLATGSTRVVASFWRVSDESTEQLMLTFFGEIASAMDKNSVVNYAAGLRKGMQRVRNDRDNPKWRSPYYWAPFALIGPANSSPPQLRPNLQVRK